MNDGNFLFSFHHSYHYIIPTLSLTLAPKPLQRPSLRLRNSAFNQAYTTPSHKLQIRSYTERGSKVFSLWTELLPDGSKVFRDGSCDL